MANPMPTRRRKHRPGKATKDGTDQQPDNHDPSRHRQMRNPRLHEKRKQCQRKLDTIAINAYRHNPDGFNSSNCFQFCDNNRILIAR
jgi:hypothetical protein